MLNKKFLDTFTLTLFYLPFILASDSNLNSLKQKLNKTLSNSSLNLKQSGFILQNSNGDTLLKHKPELALNPASSMKVLLSAAALDQLGPSHHFKTMYQYDNKNKALYVTGGNDPYFTSEDLMHMSQRIRSMLRKDQLIESLCLEAPNSQKVHTGFNADKHRAFSSPNYALSLNFNSITAHIDTRHIQDNAFKSAKANITFSPKLLHPIVLKHNNKLTVVSKSSKYKSKIQLKMEFDSVKKQFIASLNGSVRANTYREVYASIHQPNWYFAQALSDSLLKNNLIAKQSIADFNSKIHFNDCLQTTLPSMSGSYRSNKSLSQVIAGMNKFSNNFMAHMLEDFLSKHHKNTKTWLNDKAFNIQSSIINNPSGLDRNNRISAQLLLNVFKYAAQHPQYGPEFLSSLSLSASDGTLKNQFKKTQFLKGHIRAKSGTLSGATSLVGQVQSPTYGLVYFAFIINKSGKYTYLNRQFFQDLLMHLF